MTKKQRRRNTRRVKTKRKEGERKRDKRKGKMITYRTASKETNKT